MTTREQNQLMREAESGPATQDFIPQYADSKGLARITGLTRSHAYLLASEGKIESVCIRRPGSTRGKRLWHIPSVLAFFETCKEGARYRRGRRSSPEGATSNPTMRPVWTLF
jgi:hypothetical protein